MKWMVGWGMVVDTASSAAEISARSDVERCVILRDVSFEVMPFVQFCGCSLIFDNCFPPSWPCASASFCVKGGED